MKRLLAFAIMLCAFTGMAQLIPFTSLNTKYFSILNKTNLMVLRSDTATLATNLVDGASVNNLTLNGSNSIHGIVRMESGAEIHNSADVLVMTGSSLFWSDGTVFKNLGGTIKYFGGSTFFNSSGDIFDMWGNYIYRTNSTYGGLGYFTGNGGGLTNVPIILDDVKPTPDYTSWARSGLAQNFSGTGESFAQVGNSDKSWGGPGIWDPQLGKWVCFVGVDDGSGLVPGNPSIYRFDSLDGSPNSWQHPTLVLSTNTTAGQWDCQQVTVPFVWYEPGQARPWRMIYRGANDGAAVIQLGLATGTNSSVFERLDCNGATITRPMITNSVPIDEGNVILANGIYYLYWNYISTGTQSRKLLLSTCSGDPALTNWVFYGSNTNVIFDGKGTASGAWDYDDANHTGDHLVPGYGWFCPGVYRWDLPDGTPEWRMFIPTYFSTNGSGGYNASIAVFSSPSPLFTKQNRIFRGFVAQDRYGKMETIDGVAPALSGFDVPRIYCETIEQNPFKRNGAAPIVRWPELWLSAKTTNHWTQEIYRQPSGLAVATVGGATNGWSISNLSYIFPKLDPVLQLNADGRRSNVVAQFKPSQYRYFDLSGYNINLTNSHLATYDDLGILCSAGAYGRTHAATNIPAWATITNDFTLEFSADKLSFAGAASNRAVVAISGGSANHILYCFYTGSANNDSNGTLNVSLSDEGGTTRTFTTAAFRWDDNAYHTFAFSRFNTNMYWFKDGAIMNAGGTAFTFQGKNQISPTNNISLYIGIDQAGTFPWIGHVDDIRFSSVGRYTNACSVTPLPIYYTTNTGYAFSRVLDYGNVVAKRPKIKMAVPPGSTYTLLGRAAASATDKSVTPSDFTQTQVTGRYHQWVITMIGNMTNSPNIQGFEP